MDELIAEFLTETGENMNELDMDLVKLEQNPNDQDLLSQIFRIIHTVKGTCGFLGLPRLEKVAHHGEDVLGLFRDSVLEVTPEYVTLIFESLDRIKYILGEIEQTGSEPEGDDTELIEKLKAVYESVQNGDSEQEAAAALAEFEAKNTDVNLSVVDNDNTADATIEADTAADVEIEANIEAAPTAAPAPVNEDKKPETTNAPAQNKKATSVTNQSLRVNVDVLENLMTMVSELVLTRNQLLQILRQQQESEFAVPLQRLNHVVSDLQEGVMKTRMQPIGNAWAKLPRIIRDLSIELGKKIELRMSGEDTELDRQVLELIKDPLTHMVRNSGDHGIEGPEDRAAAGKNETGVINLKAYHEGGHIIIQIADDGRGLAVDKIKAKAIANNLATEEELDSMSDQQIQKFIFHAGFSKAEQVTSVSGRGVGMDVVRTNIEKIGGSIDLVSTEGRGSTFTIKIPLTLAIVSALIVESGRERFAIPQLAVRELVMTSTDGDNRIETIKGTPVFRLRDTLLPLVSLEEVLGITSWAKEAEETPASIESQPSEDQDSEAETLAEQEDEKITAMPETSQDKYAGKYIVVTQVGAYNFGIIVDRVFDTEEIVVKPVAKLLKDNEMFSGNTILGDGSVIMILDPSGIAKSTGDIDTADSSDAQDEAVQDIHAKTKTSLLLFSTGDSAPKAVPLELVARLEEIKTENIEKSGQEMVIQYRGKLMPLIPFSTSFDFMSRPAVPALVFSDKNLSMGLIVDKIIDITEQYIDIQISSTQAGTIGSAIINDKATDVVDINHFIRQTGSEWFKDHDDKPFGEHTTTGQGESKRVLLVEDSPFFRNMLTPLLQAAGYTVTSTENPLKALALCEAGHKFDIIVSDIEMPEMSGFEFAEKVKATTNWQDIPMVALSSHATPQDKDRGLEVGFTDYVAKFDRDNLLSALSETLARKEA